MALNQNYAPDRPVVRGILSGLANDPAGYFADKLCPALPGAHKGQILTIGGGTYFGDPQEDGRHIPGATVSRGPGLAFSPVTYNCESYAREEIVPKELIRRTEDDLPVPIMQTYMAAVMGFLRTGRDKRVATLITGTTWANNNTNPAGANLWNVSTGDPIAQIVTARDAIIGAKPNVILFGHGAWSAFSTNPNVLGAMDTTSSHALADAEWFQDAVGRKLGIAQVIVVDSAYNTSGDPEALSNARILNDSCFIACQAGFAAAAGNNSDLVVQPTALARVVESDFEVDEYEVKERRSRAIQIEHSEKTVVVNTGCGALITGVLT